MVHCMISFNKEVFYLENLFSKRLKEERLLKHYTQQELADIMNDTFYELDKKISRNSITRYENGTRTPDYTTLCAISHALDVDIDYLLGRSDKKRITFINEELSTFIQYINSISEKDNSEINKKLWLLIGNYKNLIKVGIEHELLKTISEIINLVDSTVNFSINTNNHEILINLKKDIDKNLKNLLNKNLIKLTRKSTEELIDMIVKNKDYINCCEHLSESDIDLLKIYYDDVNENDIPLVIKELLNKCADKNE